MGDDLATVGMPGRRARRRRAHRRRASRRRVRRRQARMGQARMRQARRPHASIGDVGVGHTGIRRIGAGRTSGGLGMSVRAWSSGREHAKSACHGHAQARGGVISQRVESVAWRGVVRVPI